MSKVAPQKKRLSYKPMYLSVIQKIIAYKEAKAAVKAQKKVLEKLREAMDHRMEHLYDSITAYEEAKAVVQEKSFPPESFKTPEGQETGRGVEALDDADSGRSVSRKLLAEIDAVVDDEVEQGAGGGAGKGVSRAAAESTKE